MSETPPPYSTATVAKMAGVHRDTLLRWLRHGLVAEPARDWRGWRVFSSKQAAGVASFARSGLEGAPNHVAVRAPLHDSLGLQRLRSVDWDFAEAKTIYLTHGIHPYPAKFIPQIPNALVQELSSVGETVIDIFCGSGTTLVESLLLKRHAIGVDANPLACLISTAKTTRLLDGDAELLQELVERSARSAESVALPYPNLFDAKPFTSSAPRPSDKALDFWFEPFIIEELAEILSWCRTLPTESSRLLALTCFSSIVVSVSKQDSDTRYVRRKKDLTPGEAFRRFSRALSEATRTATEVTELVEPRFSCRVIHADLLSQPDIGPVDLVVCSPPYPNAYSYHLYHMTRMLWLGMDYKTFKKNEIGSHRKYSNKGKNGATVETFRSEMERIFSWLRQHLKPNKYACFVIGDSTLSGKKINNADVISDAAQRQGIIEVARIQRTMQDSRKSFNPSIGKIKNEQILILRNRPG